MGGFCVADPEASLLSKFWVMNGCLRTSLGEILSFGSSFSMAFMSSIHWSRSTASASFHCSTRI